MIPRILGNVPQIGRITYAAQSKHDSRLATSLLWTLSRPHLRFADKRIEVTLPGLHGSKESNDAYAALLLKLQAGAGSLPSEVETKGVTGAELVARYLREHVEEHFRTTDGKHTSEKASIISVLTPLVRFYADKQADALTPMVLRHYRCALIADKRRTPEEEKKRRCKGHKTTPCGRPVNAYVGRV